MSIYKVLSVLVLSLVATITSVSVFAGNGPGTPDNSRGISWAELLARCANPDQFDVQRAPQNIKIQCTDIRREFVAAPPGDIPLSGARRVVTAVFADKFHVSADQKELPIFAKSGSCLRFKEVEKTMTIERLLTCADVLSLKGDPSDICISALDAAKGANPKLIETRDLPGGIDTCSTIGSIKPPK